MTCKICGCENNELMATKIREGNGRIVRCKECGTIFQDTEYSVEELNLYYNGEYCKTNSLDSGIVQSPATHFEERLETMKEGETYNKIIKLIEDNFTGKVKILEIGASTGELLHLLCATGLIEKAVGIELNKEFVDWGNANLDSHILMIDKDLSEVTFAEKFDVVISNYTLDHLPDPKHTLLKMKEVMKEDGIMYIEIPNRDEALNYYLSPTTKGSYQTFFWHKAHMFYWDKETIKYLLNEIGMECEVSCFHEYTLKNYLQWYYCGKPGRKFGDEINEVGLFSNVREGGYSEFELRMNELMRASDIIFKGIMRDTFSGDTLCVIARKEEK